MAGFSLLFEAVPDEVVLEESFLGLKLNQGLELRVSGKDLG